MSPMRGARARSARGKDSGAHSRERARARARALASESRARVAFAQRDPAVVSFGYWHDFKGSIAETRDIRRDWTFTSYRRLRRGAEEASCGADPSCECSLVLLETLPR